MKEPIPGMDKRKSKNELLYLQAKNEQHQKELAKQSGRKSRRQETAIFYDGLYFAQTPQALIRNPNISHAAVRLYGIYHTYSQNKKLINQPSTFVSQERLASNMGASRVTIWKLTKILENEGWLIIKRRGLNMTNIIILHSRKKRRR